MVLQIPYDVGVVFDNVREIAGNAHLNTRGWEFRRKKNDQLPRKTDKSVKFFVEKSREEAIFGFQGTEKTSVSFYIKNPAPNDPVSIAVPLPFIICVERGTQHCPANPFACPSPGLADGPPPSSPKKCVYIVNWQIT
jgi:hypothetical protein